MAEMILAIGFVIIFWGFFKAVANSMTKNVKNLGSYSVAHTSALAKTTTVDTNAKIRAALVKAGYDNSKLTLAEGIVILDALEAMNLAENDEQLLNAYNTVKKYDDRILQTS